MTLLIGILTLGALGIVGLVIAGAVRRSRERTRNDSRKAVR